MSEEVKSLAEDFAGLVRGLAMEDAFYRHDLKSPFLTKQDMGSVNFLSISINSDNIVLNDNAVPDFRALYTFICIFESVSPENREKLQLQQNKSRELGLLVDFVLVDLSRGSYENLAVGKITDKKLKKALDRAFEIKAGSSENMQEIGKQATIKAFKAAKEVRPVQRLYIFSPVGILVIINVIIFFVGMLLEIYTGQDPFKQWGILDSQAIEQGQVWRLFTAMFLHADLTHLFGNMYLLIMLGRALANNYSNKKLVAAYLTSGVVGCILSFLFLRGRALGASGAIMGLGGVLLCKMLFSENRRYYRQGLLYANLALMIVFNLGYGLFNTGIDNFGHFGGFICGFLIELLFEHINLQKKA